MTLASWAWRRSSLFLVACLDQLVDQMGGCGEAHGKALLAGGEAEGESNMRLPDAAWAEQDYVLTARDVLAAREIQHQHLVERSGLP